MNHLVIVRHGQSIFNQHDRFTGWTDVGLSDLGCEQAMRAGNALRGRCFDRIFASDLHRAVHTADIILRENQAADSRRSKSDNYSILRSPALRGRNDGELVGMDITATARQYGNELAPLWRKSYDLRLPGGESLADVTSRVGAYMESEILPRVGDGENVLVVTHGNTIRAALVYLAEQAPDQVGAVTVPNGSIWTWDFDSGVKLGCNVWNGDISVPASARVPRPIAS